MSEVDSPWLTASEVIAYLGGIHRATLHRYRKRGLPVHYLGGNKRKPRYHRDEVDAWIRSQIVSDS